MKDSRKHKLWMETLSREPRLQIKSETSRELKSVNDLVHNRFLVVSKAYMKLVDDSDRNRAVPRSEPGKLIEALFEARAESRAQAHRTQELELQVEQLQESLAKARKKIRASSADVRKVEQQMHDLRASKSWRMLDKLARARVWVLGGGPKND
jgi:cell division protein FtsB